MELVEKKGIEGIEKCLDLASKNVALGFKIAKDGVGADDIVHLPQVFENVKELVAFIAEKPEIADEIKDLDAAEGIQILQKIYEEYKEVKAEV